MRTNKESNYNQRSEELEEILGIPPVWPIRFGSMIFFVILTLIVIGSWVISYPDYITSKITITTKSPPSRLTSKSAGRILKIWVNDGDLVIPNQNILVIENNSNYEDMLKLINLLEADSAFKQYPFANDITLDDNLSLGDIQQTYGKFIKALKELQLFINEKPYLKQVSHIETQIKNYKFLQSLQKRKLNLYKEELKLSESAYQREEYLHTNGVTSKQDFETNQQIYISKKQRYQEIEVELVEIDVKLSDLQNQVTTIKFDENERSLELKGQIQRIYFELIGEIESWKQKYLLRSPIQGHVTFFSKLWSVNQYVEIGDELSTIVPIDSTKIIGKMLTPISNSGKIKKKQKVNIFLDNYPFEEFGILEGRIERISLVPKDNLYSIEVSLISSELITTHHKKLTFKNEMQGEANIITDDIRLINRIFFHLRKLTKTERI